MSNDRVKALVEDLERLLLDFMRKHRITHEEYRLATVILVGTVKAGEESLLYDVFLEAEATDIGNDGREGSPEVLKGRSISPTLLCLRRPMCFLSGSTRLVTFCSSTAGLPTRQVNPWQGLGLDLWQADAEGLYSNIHPGIPDWNLRGQIRSDANGTYEVQTVLPPPYEIPKDGPTGRVLSALGRHFFGPAHLHVKLRHPSYGELTSQIYFRDGQYLNSDVASAVRDGLVASLKRNENPEDLSAKGLSLPYYEVRYDFVLAPHHAHDARRVA
jgi:catechol 1,2-dioxygenase